MTMTETTNPYAEAFKEYFDAGWRGILPLPYAKKTWPPAGYTGHDGVDPSFADLHTFADDDPRNICLRLPAGVVGIDVDDYNGKAGGTTLSQLVDTYGALPPTIMSTSREDGISGIRLYKIPAGTILPSKLTDIEFVQRHHRYAVVWPSIHPEGRTYKWIDENTGQQATIPNINDLPELPQAWLAGLTQTAKEHSSKLELSTTMSVDILNNFRDGDPCKHLIAASGRAMAGGDRHDSYNEAVLAVVGAARRGCPGFKTIIKRLHDSFVSEITNPRTGRATINEANAEFARSLQGALAIVANEKPGTQCPDDIDAYVQSLEIVNDSNVMIDHDTGEIIDNYTLLVHNRLREMQINEDAKSLLQSLKAGQAPPLEGTDLAVFLAEVEEEEQFRVDEMWPSQGRVLLAAQAKTGKTTMVVNNLLPALADGGLFLGRFTVQPVIGTIVYLNMEVGTRTIRRWFKSATIDNTDAVLIVNLRGKASALNLGSEAGRKRFSEFLRAHNAEIVILDPLAPVLASLGLDENSNADVAQFFGWWTETLMAAGVVDDLVVHHAGHGGERSRGASRLLDEPDAIWTFTKDSDDNGSTVDNPLGDPPATRYLSAYGRDVELSAEAIRFDNETRTYELTGLSRSAVKGNEDVNKIIAVFDDGVPRSKNKIVENAKIKRNKAWDLVKKMIDVGELESVGKTANGHYEYLPSTLIEKS